MSTASAAACGWICRRRFYLAVAVVAVIWVMQNYTRMGRYIVAIGGNCRPRLSLAFRRKTYLILSYVICSVLRFGIGIWHSPHSSDRARR